MSRLTASSLNSSPWRQDSSFSALSVLEITYSGNLLTRIDNQASFKSSSSFKSGLKLEKTVSLDLRIDSILVLFKLESNRLAKILKMTSFSKKVLIFQAESKKKLNLNYYFILLFYFFYILLLWL